MKEELGQSLAFNYEEKSAIGARLISCMTDQICELLNTANVALGMPLEGRVKAFSSIEEKLIRKAISLDCLTELDDFVGIRVILLFRSDLSRVGAIIRENFDVISFEDTSTRLGDSQFGYQSDHYVVRIKPEWQGLPTYRGLRDLKAEVQVRTMAQHIWATASHKLQYKNEENVPKDQVRSINRVSALLETVDLELDRVNEGRMDYISAGLKFLSEDTPLNVDIASKILAELWPSRNLTPGSEDYDGLITELRHFGIITSFALRDLIKANRRALIKEEEELIEDLKTRGGYASSLESKIANGYYFTQVALTRIALRKEFGEDAVDAVIRCGGRSHAAKLVNERRKPSKRRRSPSKSV